MFYRSFSMRGIDIMVRTIVTVADAGAMALARLGVRDIGPRTLAIAYSLKLKHAEKVE